MLKNKTSKIVLSILIVFAILGTVFVLAVSMTSTSQEPTISSTNVEKYSADANSGSSLGLEITALEDGSLTPSTIMSGDCKQLITLNQFEEKYTRLSSMVFEPTMPRDKLNMVIVQQDILKFENNSTAESYVTMLRAVVKEPTCYYGEVSPSPKALSEAFGVNLDGFWLGTTISANPDPDPTMDASETQIGLSVARRGPIVMLFMGVTGGDPYDESLERFITQEDLEPIAAEMIGKFAR